MPPKYKRKRTVGKWQEYREATLINSAVRGFLARKRAKRKRARRKREDDEIMDFISRGQAAAAAAPTQTTYFPRYRPAAGGGPRSDWNTPRAAGANILMSQRGGVLPGHANIPNVYDEHVDSLRGRQNQNPHWIGTRTNHRDPNITQPSMENFIVRHGGPSRSNRPLDAAGAGLLSTLQGANQSDLADYI
jgi:hypothetical protein